MYNKFGITDSRPHVLILIMKLPLGLIVTFNPSSDFFDQLDTFYTQLEQIVVIDNGSDPDVCSQLNWEVKRRESSLTVIFNETNFGVATALNQGFGWALEHGYRHIVAFDQDSLPAPGMIPAMLDVFSTYATDGYLGVVAPVIEDIRVGKRARFLRPNRAFFFEWVDCQGRVLENVSTVITSGALYDLETYQKIGPFKDDFFIDYVDTEYCLRARQHGYKIVVACDAHLDHRLGERQKRELLGYNHFPTFHSPVRWYYISRNRIPMLRQYAIRFPHWLLYEIVASLYTLARMLLFERQRISKLRAIFLGTIDGIRGRMGKATDAALEMIE